MAFSKVASFEAAEHFGVVDLGSLLDVQHCAVGTVLSTICDARGKPCLLRRLIFVGSERSLHSHICRKQLSAVYHPVTRVLYTIIVHSSLSSLHVCMHDDDI